MSKRRGLKESFANLATDALTKGISSGIQMLASGVTPAETASNVGSNILTSILGGIGAEGGKVPDLSTVLGSMTKRIVVIGATGTGKSTLCNLLAGKGPTDDLFPAGRSMSSMTFATTVQKVRKEDNVKILEE